MRGSVQFRRLWLWVGAYVATLLVAGPLAGRWAPRPLAFAPTWAQVVVLLSLACLVIALAGWALVPWVFRGQPLSRGRVATLVAFSIVLWVLSW